MFNRPLAQEHEINKFILYENQTSSKRIAFRRKSYKGEIPVLIVVNDTINKFRANVWAKLVHKITNSHVLTIDSLHSSKIQSYVEKYKIFSVLLFDLRSETDRIIISTENENLYTFLSSVFMIESHQFTLNMDDVKVYRTGGSTTLFKIGQNVNYLNFFSFFKSFLTVHPKLSFQHQETGILGISDLPVQQNIPYNRVELHPDALTQYALHENDYVVIYNPLNFKYSVACVKRSTKPLVDEIIVSASIKKRLELWARAQIVLNPLKSIVSNKIQIQDVSKLADGDISVSEDIFQTIEEMGSAHYEIVNRVTSASIDIKRSKINKDTSLAPGTIRLSYLQREFLDFEHPPDTLSPYYFQWFHTHSDLNPEQMNFLHTHYHKQKVHKIDTYEEKQKAKKIFQTVGYNRAVIYPLSVKRKRKKLSILKRPFHFFLKQSIRPSSLKLKVIRPYSTDESSNIVRISKSVMSLLGIAENDLIQLTYRGRSVTVPVLELDSTDLIRETNIICNESTINISIGVPAHMRHKLGIKQIGKICGVERDMRFLFRKNWHTQFLPVLATIFTIYSLKVDLWIKILMMIVIIPISSYITLSAVREKIPKL